MSLSPFEVLSISAILIGALVTIWGALLRKEFAKKIVDFKQNLRIYKRRKATALLTDIKNSVSKKEEEEALEEISEYTDNWHYLTQAVSKILEEERRVHNWMKSVVSLFALTFLMGIYTSTGSQEIFFGSYSRLDTLLFLFAVEVLVSLRWLWMFFSVNRKMSTISVGGLEEIEELIEEEIGKIQKKEES